MLMVDDSDIARKQVVRVLEQLEVGGRLVIPVGAYSQDLVLVTRTEDGFERRSVTPVRFVPMTRAAR